MFGERLKKLMEEKGIRQVDLAERLGRTKACINSWIKRGNEPHSRELIEQIAEAVGTTPSYLLFGVDRSETWTKVSSDDGDYIRIPVYDVRASCGYNGIDNASERLIKVLKVAKEWANVHAPYANKTRLNVISAYGDSMSPTAESGDLVVVDTSVKSFVSDSLYVFLRDGELFLKRIQRIPNGVRVISDNTMYPPFDLKNEDLEGIEVVGKVCTIGKFTNF